MNESPTQTQPGPIAHYVIPALRGWPFFVLAALCVLTVPHTPLKALGPLTVALLAGMLVRPLMVRAVSRETIVFVSRIVLRVAVVLTAVRLDGMVLLREGPGPLLIAVLSILVGFATFAVLLRLARIEPRVGALLAIGTTVCGAAAIMAARPVVQPSAEEKHVSIAIISVLGAIASVTLIGAVSFGWVSLDAYGLLAGGSLHEVAHVMAAANAAPSVVGVATVTKLARVAMLPIALVILPWVAPHDGQDFKRVRFHMPGLVVGFFALAVLSTVLAYLTRGAPEAAASWHTVSALVVQVSTYLMGASMAAIGVLVDWKALGRAGARAIIVAIIGAIILAGVILVAANFLGAPAAHAVAAVAGP